MFNTFLNSLKRPNNQYLIETIQKGYQTLFENKNTHYELADMLEHLPIKETAKNITEQIMADIADYYKNDTQFQRSKKYTANIEDKCVKPYVVEIDVILSNNNSYVNDAQEDYMNIKLFKRENADFNTQQNHMDTLKDDIYNTIEHECGHYFLSQKGVETCIYHNEGMNKYYYDIQEIVLHSKTIYNKFVMANPNWMDLDIDILKKRLMGKVKTLPIITNIQAPFPLALQKKYFTLIMKKYINPTLNKKNVT
jgi:hypothetical protein